MAGNWSPRLPQREVPPSKPWATHEERLLDETLQRAMSPPDLVGAAGPPLPQIVLFPPRYGYGTKDERTPTIESVLHAGRWFPDRRVNFSGGEGSFTGTSQPSMSPNPF